MRAEGQEELWKAGTGVVTSQSHLATLLLILGSVLLANFPG